MERADRGPRPGGFGAAVRAARCGRDPRAVRRGLLRGLLGALGAALAVVPAGALAHGPRAHGETRSASPPEQKPWGIAGDPRRVSRTIEIAMNDRMRFVPDAMRVREGETVRLRVRNTGRLLHELVIGTRQELDEHAALMLRFPDMEHDEPWMVHVDPGRRGEIVWHFNRAGEFEFACLIAGHYQAGMTGRITVVPVASR